MFKPITGPHRTALDLDGYWHLLPDPTDTGEADGWARGFESRLRLAVPGSWNEQLSERGLADYVGAVWLMRRVWIPSEWADRRVWLRVGSADYEVSAWIEGCALGTSEAAFLPFDAELTGHVSPGTHATLVLRVDNRRDADTIPQGIAAHEYAEAKERGTGAEHFPSARYDFFPYGGLHRSATLYAVPQAFVRHAGLRPHVDAPRRNGVGSRSDARLTVTPHVDGDADGLRLTATLTPIPLYGHDPDPDAQAVARASGDPSAALTLHVAGAHLWSAHAPHRYALTLALHGPNGREVDRYTVRTGLRGVRTDGPRLLVNSEPVYLRGFGKHEDFPVVAKAHSPQVLVKDMELLRWIGANSFRTSHYPYHEDWLEEADRRGLYTIDEVPAVSLNHSKTTDRTQAAHAAAIRALIRRDGHHPSVLMWALGNEPGLSGESEAGEQPARDYWAPLFALARTLDPTRLLIVPTHGEHPGKVLYPLGDVCALNRYYGWYTQPGQLDVAARLLRDEMDAIAHAYDKPILLTEFGADTLAGWHDTAGGQFSEEFQARMIEVYCRVAREHSHGVGAHVWNFADFRTPQNFRRVGLNLKGVFTQTRRPKRAAHLLRELWRGAPMDWTDAPAEDAHRTQDTKSA
jgi:beta-glucuronidase